MTVLLPATRQRRGGPLLTERSMFFTKKDSATAYAAACRKWYGARAETFVRSQIKRLEAKGDLYGAETWRLVAGLCPQRHTRLVAGDAIRLQTGGLQQLG